MKTIIKERSETLTTLMEKLVVKSDHADSVSCKILEMDDSCVTPKETGFNFFSYTVYQEIAYRGIEDAVCSRAYQALTNEKWKNWCRRAFALDAVVYLISIVLLTFVAVTSVNSPNVVVYQSPIDYTRAIFEIFLLLNAARILGFEIYQTIRLKNEYLVDKMNIVEITSPVLLLLLLPVRYIHEQTHWYMYAVTYLVWSLQIVKYAMVFKFTGVFVDSLQKMLVKDILRFGIVLSITIVIFSGTFLLVLKAENTLQLHEETMSFWTIGIVGIRIMIESDSIVEYTGDDGYKFAGAMVMMAFMFFIIVVLLNMLIAKMMNTYKEIEKSSLNGFRVRRAKIVARMEREHMSFPFNIFNIDANRELFYKEEITGGVNDMSDTGIMHDDSLTLQQNVEDRVKKIQNTINSHYESLYCLLKAHGNKEDCVTKISNTLNLHHEIMNSHLMAQSNDIAKLVTKADTDDKLHKNVEELKLHYKFIKSQLKSEKENNQRLRNSINNMRNAALFVEK